MIKPLLSIFVSFILLTISGCSSEEKDPIKEESPIANNSIEFEGDSKQITWGEFSYEGVWNNPESPHLNGQHIFYLALYPSDITYNVSNDTYSGQGWYIEMEPLLSDNKDIVGNYEGDGSVWVYYNTNVTFPINGDNEADIIDTPVYEEGQLSITKTGNEYEIKFQGKDREDVYGDAQIFKFHYKGELIEN
ncbi:hypothetical protein [Carboxylicivirga sp. N1Y90]|uniref:hypothetical protein n=1 Tax=Carboxylicivirga fragile TaxID=3417571 RepID=UPI003D347930|nr:hypothetical protein [Marinilabiliaceae bacterium N1Y90]